MPFARDTLSNLIEKTLADFAVRLGGSNPFLRRSVLNVLGRVIAARHHEELGYLDWQSRMSVPVTARGEYLAMWGALKNVFPKEPNAASGTATITGGIPTTPISNGTELQRSDGALYKMTAGATLDGSGNATLSLTAEVAGSAGDSDVGTPLTFVSPISGVPASATVVTMTGGTDIEQDDAFLARVLQAYRAPPQGGDLDDYVTWALQVSEVTRAWAGGPTIMGAGTVSVYFMIDDSGHTNGLPIGTNGVSQFETRDTPAAGDQLLVADHIFPLRPVTALVYGMAPVGNALNLTLAEVPVDTTIRQGITDALAAFLIREASPGGVTFQRLQPDGTFKIITGGTIDISRLDAAISAVPNLDHFVRTSPVADVTVATGHISIPGTITFS